VCQESRPFGFVILGDLGKNKRGVPALSMYLSEATPGGRDSGAPFWNHENVIKRGEPGVPGVTPFWIRDFRGFRKKTNEAFRPCRCAYLKRHLEGATSARRFGGVSGMTIN
jgi:hypothetical protein